MEKLTSLKSESGSTEKHTSVYDVIVVGAGFAGMYMLHELRKIGLNVLVLEEATGVGGTWYWNRYPGARCDVESMEYSYSFSNELQQEWNWSHRFSTQPEILEYANHVADRFDLRGHIKFETRVNSVEYEAGEKQWLLRSSSGEEFYGRYCVMATGTLSSVNQPKFAGLDKYQGDWYVTGRWPHDGVDFSGKNVGIIGTGSSAVQAIPVIAKEAKHLTVFQRTANYSIPAKNRPLESNEVDDIKNRYAEIRKQARENRAGIASMKPGLNTAMSVSETERHDEYQRRWDEGGTGFTAAYSDIGTDDTANFTAAEFVRDKIKETVNNSVTAELLAPTNTIGCKRLCADTDYYETYNRVNVTLLDVNVDPIKGLVKEGVQTENNVYEFDIVIFAIGFDAMTGALLSMNIKGKEGLQLRDIWSDGPQSYLGLSMAGFPNLFTITGPGSPSVLSNMMTSIEQHVEWIRDCLSYMEAGGFREIEPKTSAEERWMSHVEEIAGNTLRYTCNSWYVGANIPGKKRIFMPYAGGIPPYREKCDQVAASGYDGFNIS